MSITLVSTMVSAQPCSAVFPDIFQTVNGGTLKLGWTTDIKTANGDATLPVAKFGDENVIKYGVKCDGGECIAVGDGDVKSIDRVVIPSADGGEKISNSGELTGKKYASVSVPMRSETRLVAPSDGMIIGQLSLQYRATITLSSGDYYIGELTNESPHPIIKSNGDGPVRIFVNRAYSAAYNTQILGSTDSPILLHVNDSINTQTNFITANTLLSSASSIKIGANSDHNPNGQTIGLSGGFNAPNIELENNQENLKFVDVADKFSSCDMNDNGGGIPVGWEKVGSIVGTKLEANYIARAIIENATNNEKQKFDFRIRDDFMGEADYWPMELAKVVNQNGGGKVKAGVKQEGQADPIPERSVSGNDIWSKDKSAKAKVITLLKLHNIHEITASTSLKVGAVVKATIDHKGELYQVEFKVEEANKGDMLQWPFELAKRINEKNIPGIQAGNRNIEGVVAPVQSKKGNKVWSTHKQSKFELKITHPGGGVLPPDDRIPPIACERVFDDVLQTSGNGRIIIDWKTNIAQTSTGTGRLPTKNLFNFHGQGDGYLGDVPDYAGDFRKFDRAVVNGCDRAHDQPSSRHECRVRDNSHIVSIGRFNIPKPVNGSTHENITHGEFKASNYERLRSQYQANLRLTAPPEGMRIGTIDFDSGTKVTFGSGDYFIQEWQDSDKRNQVHFETAGEGPVRIFFDNQSPLIIPHKFKVVGNNEKLSPIWIHSNSSINDLKHAAGHSNTSTFVDTALSAADNVYLGFQWEFTGAVNASKVFAHRDAKLEFSNVKDYLNCGAETPDIPEVEIQPNVLEVTATTDVIEDGKNPLYWLFERNADMGAGAFTLTGFEFRLNLAKPAIVTQLAMKHGHLPWGQVKEMKLTNSYGQSITLNPSAFTSTTVDEAESEGTPTGPWETLDLSESFTMPTEYVDVEILDATKGNMDAYGWGGISGMDLFGFETPDKTALPEISNFSVTELSDTDAIVSFDSNVPIYARVLFSSNVQSVIETNAGQHLENVHQVRISTNGEGELKGLVSVIAVNQDGRSIQEWNDTLVKPAYLSASSGIAKGIGDVTFKDNDGNWINAPHIYNRDGFKTDYITSWLTPDNAWNEWLDTKLLSDIYNDGKLFQAISFQFGDNPSIPSDSERAKYLDYIQNFAARIQDARKMANPGANTNTLISIEAEYNAPGGNLKNWPGYSKLMNDAMNILHSNDIDVCLFAGSWDFHNYIPKSLEDAAPNADCFATQRMAASTDSTHGFQDTSTPHEQLVWDREYLIHGTVAEKAFKSKDEVIRFSNYLRRKFMRPVRLDYLMVSEHPGSLRDFEKPQDAQEITSWSGAQEYVAKQFCEQRQDLIDAGLTAMSWMAYRDNPNLGGPYGAAEKHKGLLNKHHQEKSPELATSVWEIWNQCKD
ncbi:hypothetical protein [Vibrio nomapromontoriensis]|uniref:hypothetical protein n=1 Tax=Vibrio nomapromontoriensis TaxID=2910246 RepID=UPI003D0C81E2